MDSMDFDYVVVGAGGSGAVLARALAEEARSTVALIEAGSSDEGRDEILDFRRYQEAVAGPLARLVPIVPPEAGHGRVVFPVARVLGGNTSLNTCVWFRPPDSDLAHWETLGATGWGPEGTLSCFEWLEERIRIETVEAHSPAHDAMLRAARELGFPDVDFAQAFDAGIGRYRLSKTGHLRQSTSVVFLRPPLPRNLALFTDAEATRLLFDEAGEAAGVETPRGAFRARREMILAAGAFGTPRLLLLSGIGPAEHLRHLGIPVRRDLPGVGEHLLDHPACCVNVAAALTPERLDPWNYAGVLFARVEPEAAWPDVEMQVGPELFEKQTRAAGYPSAPAGLCAYFYVNRARSEGRVRLASPDPRDEIAVDPRYFSDPEGYDLRVMAGGVRLARRLFAAHALKDWAAEELAPGAACRADDGLNDYARATVTTGYHPAGTCRMGAAADARAVVGPDLRVKGFRSLRVADASVFPSMLSVNIAAACMMVGLRAARLVAAGQTTGG